MKSAARLFALALCVLAVSSQHHGDGGHGMMDGDHHGMMDGDHHGGGGNHHHDQDRDFFGADGHGQAPQEQNNFGADGHGLPPQNEGREDMQEQDNFFGADGHGIPPQDFDPSNMGMGMEMNQDMSDPNHMNVPPVPHPGPPGPHPGPHPGPPGPPGPHPGPHPGPPGRPGCDTPCSSDFMRLCAFRVPDMENVEDILKCMDEHVSDLEPECKEMVQDATKMLEEFHATCDPDLTEVCPNAIGKSMETSECVMLHLAELSKGCLTEITKIAGEFIQHGNGHHHHDADTTPMELGLFEGFMMLGHMQNMEPPAGMWEGNVDHDSMMAGSSISVSSSSSSSSSGASWAVGFGGSEWWGHEESDEERHPHNDDNIRIDILIAAAVVGCISALATIVVFLVVRKFCFKRRTHAPALPPAGPHIAMGRPLMTDDATAIAAVQAC